MRTGVGHGRLHAQDGGRGRHQPCPRLGPCIQPPGPGETSLVLFTPRPRRFTLVALADEYVGVCPSHPGTGASGSEHGYGVQGTSAETPRPELRGTCDPWACPVGLTRLLKLVAPLETEVACRARVSPTCKDPCSAHRTLRLASRARGRAYVWTPNPNPNPNLSLSVPCDSFRYRGEDTKPPQSGLVICSFVSFR